MRGVWLVVLAACKFTPGDFPGNGTDDGGVATDTGNGDDTNMIGSDAAPPTPCVQSWLSGPTFSTATRLTVLATASSEGDPFVSRDGLRLYFNRTADIWLSKRASTSDTWGAPAVEGDLSSTASDTKLSFVDDELTVFVNSSRSGSTSDVWRGTRASIGAAWTWDRTYLTAVNATGDSQWDPHISGDGLTIYFAPTGTGLAAQLLWFATRASSSVAFGAPQTVSVNSAVKDNDPTVTLDGRVIVWASNRTGDRGLWYATRADQSQPWGTPQELTSLNTMTTSDDGPHVTEDGCQIYFSSDRAGGSGGDDIYFANVN